MHKFSSALVALAQRSEFDEIIDVRSPAEFAEDHIPGAINCPVLDDEERKTVGTLYKQVSPFEARRVGAAMVARNMARHLDERLFDRPKSWRPLLYCWRGGMRSGSFVTWMRMIGWGAGRLEGGYKTWRHYVLDELERLPAQYNFQVICGPTGSGKTRVLTALSAQGAQVLDLEDCAAHRGSVLGGLPDTPQPSQKWFETLLAHKLTAFDAKRPVFLEAESRKIGCLRLPEALSKAMHAAACIEISSSREARLHYLLEDYKHLGDDPLALQQKLSYLKGIVDNVTLAQWQQWALESNLPCLFAELIDRHYDPLYAHSQSRNYTGYAKGLRLQCDDLSTHNITRLAEQIIAKYES